MKRFLILGFLTVVVAAELAARLVAPHIPGQLIWDSQFTQDKYDQIVRTGPTDVVFVGSSVVNAGVDPDLVAASSGLESGYNAAIPATTPSTWMVWGRDVVGPILCPEMVVIGISIRDYNDNNTNIDWDLESYPVSAGRLRLYGITTGTSIEQQVGVYSTFIRIRSRLREPEKVARYVMTGEVPGWPNTSLTDEGRYLRWDGKTFVPPTAGGGDRLRNEAFLDFVVGGSEDQAVRAMIQDALAVGAQPVVVRMPTMNTPLARLLPDGLEDLAEFEAQVRQLETDFDIPVIVFEDMDDDPSLFGDLYHMNLSGTTEFSQRLGPELDRLLDPVGSAECATRPSDPEQARIP